jgi:hypothetical protein
VRLDAEGKLFFSKLGDWYSLVSCLIISI